MLRIQIFTLGTLPSPHFSSIGDNFLRALQKYAQVEIREYKTPQELLKKAPQQAYLLDERGHLHTSRAFAALLMQNEDRGDTLSFIIGGPDGFSAQEKQPFAKISLSPMTTTHDLARLFLYEQLFRGLSIVHNSAYHRDE